MGWASAAIKKLLEDETVVLTPRGHSQEVSRPSDRHSY